MQTTALLESLAYWEMAKQLTAVVAATQEAEKEAEEEAENEAEEVVAMASAVLEATGKYRRRVAAYDMSGNDSRAHVRSCNRLLRTHSRYKDSSTHARVLRRVHRVSLLLRIPHRTICNKGAGT